MAQHASEPPEHSAVFERSPARSAAALAPPPMVVASACRTTRAVVAWAVATELGLRCYVAASAREALARLGLDPEGIPLMGSANATPMTQRPAMHWPAPGQTNAETASARKRWSSGRMRLGSSFSIMRPPPAGR